MMGGQGMQRGHGMMGGQGMHRGQGMMGGQGMHGGHGMMGGHGMHGGHGMMGGHGITRGHGMMHSGSDPVATASCSGQTKKMGSRAMAGPTHGASGRMKMLEKRMNTMQMMMDQMIKSQTELLREKK